MTLRDIGVVFGIEVDQKSVNTVENTIKSVKNVATKLLGAVAISFSFSALNSVAEEFNGINDKIRNATREMGDQEEIQQKILQAANDTRMAYSDMADFVTQLVQEDKNIFGDLDTATEFATLTTKTLKAAGRADSEITSAQTLLNKAFAEGSMSSATFTKMLKSYPEIINTMAEGLGVTTDQLSAMADAGQITSQTLVDAFSGAADTIDANFEELDYSISDAITNIKNSWGLFVDDLWTGSGLANDAGKMMVRAFNGFLDVLKKIQPYVERLIRFLLSGIQNAMDLISRVSSFVGRLVDRIGGVENALKLVAIVAGSIWLALNASKILEFLKNAKGLLSGANLQILGIIAVIVALALIVEDFINFMQGNDSVIGTLFDKMGIGADNARETISNGLTFIKNFIQNTLSTIWSVVKSVVNSISDFIENHSDQIQSVMTRVGDALQSIFNAILAVAKVAFSILFEVAQTIFNALSAFWTKWGSTIISTFSSLWDSLIVIINGFLDVVQGIADFISSIFSGDWQGAWDSAGQIVSGAIEMISGYLSGLLQIFLTIFTMIGDTVVSILSNIAPGAAEVIGNIVNIIEEGLQSAIDWITSLPSQAVQWGADIISGIAEGITGAISQVTDAVSGVAEKISSFLHFSVPDEGPLADFQSWMPDMMSGLAEGIEDNESTVMDKVNDLASGISTLVQSATASAATASSGAASNSSTTNVTQNNTFNNSYSGSDRETQKNVSKGMNQSAQDATTYLAKGLAYAR